MLYYLFDHAKAPSTGTAVGAFLRDLLLFNGVVLPAAIFAALAVSLARGRRASAMELFLALLGLLYFLPSVSAQPRIDYGSMYLTPWAVLLAVRLDASRRAWRPAAAALALVLAFTVAWGLHTVRDLQWPVPKAVIARLAYETGRFPDTSWLLTLNEDDYMKATGYWIREHVPMNDQVGMYGGYWQLWTLEIYSGRTVDKHERDLGFGVREAREPALVNEPAVPNVSPAEPRFHWALVLHPYKSYRGIVDVTDANYVVNRLFVEETLKYQKAGEVVHDGRPVVSIYTDRAVPFVRVDTRSAGKAWDRKYANLKSLAVSRYVGQAISY
jgi:hypothetical protein